MMNTFGFVFFLSSFLAFSLLLSNSHFKISLFFFLLKFLSGNIYAEILCSDIVRIFFLVCYFILTHTLNVIKHFVVMSFSKLNT